MELLDIIFMVIRMVSVIALFAYCAMDISILDLLKHKKKEGNRYEHK